MRLARVSRLRVALVTAVFLLLLVGLPRLAEASCSGSGTTWSCTSGTTPSQINTTLSSATDGATLTFAAGSYTWGGGTRINLPSTKAVTFICETAPPSSAPWGATTSGGCEVSASQATFELPHATTSKNYRISGFDVAGSQWVALCPGGGCADTIVTSLRIDHNTITNGSLAFISDTATFGYVEGVADHNRMIQSSTTNSNDFFYDDDNTYIVGNRVATGNNFFFEDNSFELTGTGSDDGNGAGCVDGGDGIGIVMRFNTSDDCRFLMHGATHGGGPTNFEVYFNTLSKKAGSALGGYRMIHHQGSDTYMVFENVLSAASHETDAIVVQSYRSFSDGGASPMCDGTQGIDGNRTPLATYRGYPCDRQAGREVDGTLSPMYAFRNRWADDGAKADIEVNGGQGTDYTSLHLVENRDLYNAVSANAQTSASSPFDGTVGVGYGTLANRPTTCTPGPEAADAGHGGVGYWATDQGEWNSTNGSTPDGQLYTCTATNTWTLTYIPYTYPHPLVSGDTPTESGRRPPFLTRPGDQ